MRKYKKLGIIALLLFCIDICVFPIFRDTADSIVATLHFVCEADRKTSVRIYYSESMDFNDDNSEENKYLFPSQPLNMNIHFDAGSKYLRIDLENSRGIVRITDISILIGAHSYPISYDRILSSDRTNNIESVKEIEEGVQIITSGDDPWIVVDISDLKLVKKYKKVIRKRNIAYSFLQILLLDLGLLAIMFYVRNMKNSSYADFEDLQEKRSKLASYQWFIIFAVFIILVSGSIMVSIDYCPDEVGRWSINEFIFKYGKLPTGDEEEVMLIPWGFSYAFYPYLSSMIGGFFMRLASVFTKSADFLRLMGRMCSILSITGTSYFIQKTGNLLFRKKSSSALMAVVICFMPQVMFLGMYLNNDALTLLFISMMLFFLIRGHNKCWDYASCVYLGISMAIGLLSYYSVYVWGLSGLIAFIISLLCNKGKRGDAYFVIKRVAIIAMTVFVLAGWFFIRNALLHNGDFLGLETAQMSVNKRLADIYIVYNPASRWVSSIPRLIIANKFEWTILTIQSLIAVFGYMGIFMPQWQYWEYYMLMILALFAFITVMIKTRKNKLTVVLTFFLTMCSAMTVLLSLIQSYIRDYQPQGRYIISVTILIGYIFAYDVDNIKIFLNDSYEKKSCFDANNRVNEIDLAKAIIILWIYMFTRCYFQTMIRMFV